ncbi:hypothetical protein [Paracidovorax avenae]|nr:hypothetical protein [Paracidovorax avenae]
MKAAAGKTKRRAVMALAVCVAGGALPTLARPPTAAPSTTGSRLYTLP